MSTQCVLFDLRQAGALRLAEGPLARVCGLPVLVRTMLALAHAGYESGRVLVAPEGREALERTLLRHPNACAALDVSVEVGEGGDLPDPEDPVEGTMLYWPGSLTFGRLVPDLALAAPDPGEGITAEDPADGPATGLLLLSQEVWASAAGKSAENVRRDLEANMAHFYAMRERLHVGLLRELGAESIRLNGHPEKRLPNTLNLSFRGVEANVLLEEIREQVAASAGAACHADLVDVSAVLKAMDVPIEWAKGTVRFSVGRGTTADEIDRAVAIVSKAVRRGREDDM